jgi:hypothetical protein
VDERTLRELIDAVKVGRLGRRDFTRTMLALGLAYWHRRG